MKGFLVVTLWVDLCAALRPHSGLPGGDLSHRRPPLVRGLRAKSSMTPVRLSSMPEVGDTVGEAVKARLLASVPSKSAVDLIGEDAAMFVLEVRHVYNSRAFASHPNLLPPAPIRPDLCTTNHSHGTGRVVGEVGDIHSVSVSGP